MPIDAAEAGAQVFRHPKGGVKGLLELAGNQECDWLEFKAALSPAPDTPLKLGENAADYHWHAVRALLALANSHGGCVLVGVNDLGTAVGLSASDGKGILGREGFNAFIRKVVRPALLPDNGTWATGEAGIWTTDVKQLESLVSLERGELDGQDILVLIVKPLRSDQPPLTAKRKHPTPKEAVFARQPGDFGETKELGAHQLWEWPQHRKSGDSRFDHLLDAFFTSIGENAPPSPDPRPEDPVADQDLAAPSADLCDEIIEILKRQPDGMTSVQIRRHGQSHPAYHKINRALSHLQSRGVIRLLRGTTWRLIGQFPAATEGQKAHAIAATISGGSRWEPFRRLCRYYADCARAESNAHVLTYSNQVGRKFINLDRRIDWPDFSAGQPALLNVSQIPAEFLRLALASNAPALFIGGPVQLWVRGGRDSDQVRIIEPVFLIPVRAKLLKHEMLQLQALGPPEINSKWLDDFFRKRADDRREFIEQCGQVRPSDDSESDVSAWTPPDLPHLFQTLSLLRRDDWREPACIYMPNNAPQWDELEESGIYNRLIVAVETAQPYTARLQREIRLISEASDADLDNTALSLLFPHKPLQQSRSDDEAHEDAAVETVEVDLLNNEQRTACMNAATAALSTITGPPGTGKSRVVANVMVHAALNRHSVLFASRNHQALEAVVPKLNELVDGQPFAIRLSRPYGEVSENPFAEALKQLFSNAVLPGEASEHERLITDVQDGLVEIAGARKQIDELRQLYASAGAAETALAAALKACPQELEDRIRMGQRPPGLAAIDDILAVIGPLVPTPARFTGRLCLWLKRVVALQRIAPRARALLSESYREFKQTNPPAPLVAGIKAPSSLGALHSELLRWLPVAKAASLAESLLAQQQNTRSQGRLEDVEQEIHQHRTQNIERVKKAMHACMRTVGAKLEGADRQRLNTMWMGIQNAENNPNSRTMLRLQVRLRESFPILLRHMPLWAVANLSAGRYLPLASGLFDLLIVDEASQCDVPSVIPLLYRCRRVAVVGDPMQLKFVAATTRDTDERLRQKHDITDPEQFERYAYRNQSFFGLASGSGDIRQKHMCTLREHFRCVPHIANYFNEQFYRERLLILTESRDLQKRLHEDKLGIRWTEVPADAEAIGGGGAIAPRQVDAIVQELRRLQQAGFPGTVGVVAPFRAQADRIRDRAMEAFSSRPPEHWHLHVDTADGFQGGERDVILFSLVGGPNLPQGAEWFYEHDANRFNVAVSRAKAVLHIFGDSKWAAAWSADKPTRRHIAELVKSSQAVQPPEMMAHDPEDPRPAKPTVIGDPQLIGPVWEQRMANALWEAGLPVLQQYPACGRFLDVALLRDGLKLDVEIDGEAYHRSSDGSRRVEDLQRDTSLIANGWRVKRFWVYELRENLAACVDSVVQLWHQGTS